MGRIWIAFRAFFAALFNGVTASRIKQALDQAAAPIPLPAAPPPPSMEKATLVIPKPVQNDAVTLLATLQREARFVDFLKEDLSGYSDEQVGAAVREIQRDSSAVIERLFAVRAVLEDQEGDTVDIPAGFDAARYRLTGRLTGEAPYRGTLRHHGWKVTRCELPAFTGAASAASMIIPAEVELS
jgi:hypothetical protein